MENQKHIKAYQDLFDYLHDEHDLILLQSEMDEIIDLSAKAVRKYNEASEGDKQPDTASKCNKHIVMPRFNDDYEEDEFEDEEPDGYECMSCGNIQLKHVGLSCNRCCGPLTEWYL